MKMNPITYLCIVSAALIGSVFSDQHSEAEHLVDEVIAALNKQSFDPLVLPKYVTNVDKFLGLVHGELEVHYVKLTGLSKIHRQSNKPLSLHFDQNANRTTVQAPLEITGSHVKAQTSVSAYVGAHFHPEFRVEADIDRLSSKMSIQIDHRSGALLLAAFEIDQLSGVRFHQQGPFLPFDPIADLLGNLLVQVFNLEARHLIAERVKPIVQSALATVRVQ